MGKLKKVNEQTIKVSGGRIFQVEVTPRVNAVKCELTWYVQRTIRRPERINMSIRGMKQREQSVQQSLINYRTLVIILNVISNWSLNRGTTKSGLHC